ncbi:SLATT domain-containing protein [Aliarcobacter butzleri]|uniref:SLATT domain-containing protein n=1 Tax=Aliarcobacter butzleri TaxID=28197 RepID=UPI0013E078FD|nr:SLATT domain-containing protein [Aliarcobacter butzleri]
MAFSDKVWITRKSRINASERFKRNDLISQILIAYYSFFIIVITIVDIKNDNLNFEILTLILSILILIVSIFIFAMNYKERASVLQTSYVLMSKLYEEIKEKENKKDNYDELRNQYDMIVSLTENHSSSDYLEVMYEVKNNKDYEQVNGKWTFSKSLKIWIYKLTRFFKISFLFILPIIIVIMILIIQ